MYYERVTIYSKMVKHMKFIKLMKTVLFLISISVFTTQVQAKKFDDTYLGIAVIDEKKLIDFESPPGITPKTHFGSKTYSLSGVALIGSYAVNDYIALVAKFYDALGDETYKNKNKIKSRDAVVRLDSEVDVASQSIGLQLSLPIINDRTELIVTQLMGNYDADIKYSFLTASALNSGNKVFSNSLDAFSLNTSLGVRTLVSEKGQVGIGLSEEMLDFDHGSKIERNSQIYLNGEYFFWPSISLGLLYNKNTRGKKYGDGVALNVTFHLLKMQ